MGGWVVGRLESNAKLNSKLRLKLKLDVSLAKKWSSLGVSLKGLGVVDSLIWQVQAEHDSHDTLISLGIIYHNNIFIAFIQHLG